MKLISDGTVLKKSEQFGKYVSFFPFGGNVTDLTLEGFKYPLSNYCLTAVEKQAWDLVIFLRLIYKFFQFFLIVSFIQQYYYILSASSQMLFYYLLIKCEYLFRYSLLCLRNDSLYFLTSCISPIRSPIFTIVSYPSSVFSIRS